MAQEVFCHYVKITHKYNYFLGWSTHKNFLDINWALQPIIEKYKAYAEKFFV